MASDKNLINASKLLAESKVGVNVPNMSNQYKQTVGISKSYMDIISNIGKDMMLDRKKLKAGKEKQIEQLNKTIENNYKNMYLKGAPQSQEVILATRKAIKEIQSEYEKHNTYGDNDTQENEIARVRLEAMAAKVIQQATNSREVIASIGERQKLIRTNDLVDLETSGFIGSLNKMLDMKNMDTDDLVTATYNDNYDLVMNTIDENGVSLYSMTFDEINDKLPSYDTDLHQLLLDDNQNAGVLGAQDGDRENPVNVYQGDGYIERRKLNFLRLIDDEKSFNDFAGARLVGRDFREAVMADMNITSSTIQTMAIQLKMDPKKLLEMLDTDESGDVNYQLDLVAAEAKEVFKENFNKLYLAIIKPDAIGFNLETSKDLLADYYVDMEKQNYEVNFNKVIDEKEAKRIADYKASLPNQMRGNRLLNPQDYVKNYGENSEFEKSLRGEGKAKGKDAIITTPSTLTYQRINSEFFALDDEGNYSIPVTDDEIRAREGEVGSYEKQADIVVEKGTFESPADATNIKRSDYSIGGIYINVPNKKGDIKHKWNGKQMIPVYN